MRDREIPAKDVDEIDVGELECPKCGKTLKLIHREKATGKILKHRVEEVRK